MEFYAIPKWATYIAQDETGAWYAYEKEPYLGARCDYEKDPYLDTKYQVWMGGGKKERLTVVISSTLQKI